MKNKLNIFIRAGMLKARYCFPFGIGLAHAYVGNDIADNNCINKQCCE